MIRALALAPTITIAHVQGIAMTPLTWNMFITPVCRIINKSHWYKSHWHKVHWHILLSTVFTVSSLGTSLVFADTALAQYQPPQGAPPGGPSLSNGSRGVCGATGPIPMTIIAPTQHIGRATTKNPTLVWFAPAIASYRLHVSLYTGDLEDPELVQQFDGIEQKSGLVQFTFPETEPLLSPGQRYIWQVAIACNPEGDMYDQTLLAEVEVVDVPAAVAEELAAAETPREQVEVYAQQGYWYDALREAVTDSETSNNQDSVVALISDLAELESPDYSQILRQIADHLGQQGRTTINGGDDSLVQSFLVK